MELLGAERESVASVANFPGYIFYSLLRYALYAPPGLQAAHGICNGKKIPWEGELNLRFDP